MQQQQRAAPAIDVDDDDAWAALLEAEGVAVQTKPTLDGGAAKNARSSWLPAGMDPVLEEQPKWSLATAALEELEGEMMRREAQLTARACICALLSMPRSPSCVVLIQATQVKTQCS